MGEKEETKNSIDVHKNKIKCTPKVFDPAISSFFVQLPHKVQNYLKVSIVETFNGCWFFYWSFIDNKNPFVVGTAQGIN